MRRKKKDEEINFPGVCSAATVCSTLSAKSCLHSHFLFYQSCVCEVFYWLCLVSMNQCERHKAVVDWRRTLVRAALGPEPRCHISTCISEFPGLSELSQLRHFEDALFHGAGN